MIRQTSSVDLTEVIKRWLVDRGWFIEWCNALLTVLKQYHLLDTA